MTLKLGIIAALCITTTSCFNTNDQVEPDIPFGTFEIPSTHVRPRFRYRVPDASVDLEEIANDFVLIKKAGLGVMELLGYYLYGNCPSVVAEGGPSPVDCTTYGWGSAPITAPRFDARSGRHLGTCQEWQE